LDAVQVAHIGFVLGSASERRMGTVGVIKVDPAADPGPRLTAGLEGVEIDALVLE